jgi:hypothetical protein
LGGQSSEIGNLRGGMLTEELTALAEAGGVAVVQAAGTDTWKAFRNAVGRWFGRGDAKREHDELERLDKTVAVLQAAEAAEVGHVRIRQEAVWQARIEALLESLMGNEQFHAVAQLKTLLEGGAGSGKTSAGAGGLAIRGDVHVSATKGSIAAGVLYGGAHVRPPSPPDPPQG